MLTASDGTYVIFTYQQAKIARTFKHSYTLNSSFRSYITIRNQNKYRGRKKYIIFDKVDSSNTFIEKELRYTKPPHIFQSI